MRYLMSLALCFILFCACEAQAVVSTLVADTKSGTILSSKNAQRKQHPASLTKVMTLYLTFNALDKGLLKMDDKLPISLHAAKQPRSKMFLKAGDTIRVKDAVMALIIKSANDAAVVLAEALAPSEKEFAKMMTQTAHQLGLKNTQFRNASGLHNPEQITTAEDMALLTIALINHYPEYYKLFSKEKFWYRGKEYRSHNMVTRSYSGAEGLKTGYIAAVGYNIISTAKRNNDRLVTVVIGHNTSKSRDRQAVRLLDKGFSLMKKSRSVLKKLCAQGKYRSLNYAQASRKPNLTAQLKTMEKRLAYTRQTATKVQKERLLALQKTGVLDRLTVSKAMRETIEQGDSNIETVAVSNEANLNTSIEKSLALSPVISDEIWEELADNITEQTALLTETEQANLPMATYTPVYSWKLDENTTDEITHIYISTNHTPIDLNRYPLPVVQNQLQTMDNISNEETSAVVLQTKETEKPSETIIAQQEIEAHKNFASLSTETIEKPSKTVQVAGLMPIAPTQTEAEKEITTNQAIAEPQPIISAQTQQNKSVKKERKSVQTAQLRKKGWGVQVGAFYEKSQAQKQAQKALKSISKKGKKIAVSPNKKETIYRSRIYGFQSKKEAQQACRVLKRSQNMNCLPVL